MNTSILGHYFIYKFIIFHLVCDYLMRVFSANVLLWLCAWSFVFYHLFTEVVQKFLLIYFHSMCWNQHSPSRTFQVWTSRANFTEPMMARLICQALLASTTLKPMTTRMWSCRYEWYFFIFILTLIAGKLLLNLTCFVSSRPFPTSRHCGTTF